ncbi:MAG: SRPBCC family protein [Flavobacteriales bacterium]|nr:SRPBCC family protein [Flavobacteriales bacterium]
MGVHILKREQILKNVSLEEAWSFFSNPANLKEITPGYMGFDIVSKSNSDNMYSGQIIRYTVKPLLGIPMYWTTEIVQVNAPHFFIDQQLDGPYKIWHHQHKFHEVDGGVLMEDIIHYKPPFGIFGDAANQLLIRKKLKEIFNYRKKAISAIFKLND